MDDDEDKDQTLPDEERRREVNGEKNQKGVYLKPKAIRCVWFQLHLTSFLSLSLFLILSSPSFVTGFFYRYL